MRAPAACCERQPLHGPTHTWRLGTGELQLLAIHAEQAAAGAVAAVRRGAAQQPTSGWYANMAEPGLNRESERAAV